MNESAISPAPGVIRERGTHWVGREVRLDTMVPASSEVTRPSGEALLKPSSERCSASGDANWMSVPVWTDALEAPKDNSFSS